MNGNLPRERRRLPTFWQGNLIQEAGAHALLIALFAASSGLALAHLRQRHIAVAEAEARTVEVMLQDQLQQARQQLLLFSQQAGQDNRRPMAALLTDFSDLYELDAELEIRTIIKSRPDSQVFPGYSLRRTPLAEMLQRHGDPRPFSPLLRGFEDGRPSLYIALPDRGGLLLGRLNLDSLQRYLRQFGSASGTPVLLVARDGSVMVSSDRNFRLPAFDIKGQGLRREVRPILTSETGQWIPVLSPAASIGTAIVTLVPTSRLEEDQALILVLLLVAAIGSSVLVVLRSLRMRRLFIRPVADVARRMRHLDCKAAERMEPAAPAAFAELEAIESAFQAMADAICAREHRLHQRASTDGLTGLLNRSALLDRLERCLADPAERQSGGALALLFCDLDLFKEINDNFGHAAGDLVLRSVAERIRGTIRPDDLAGRVGGDEIIVVLRGIADQTHALAVAGKIGRAIAEPVPGLDGAIRITASIGVTLARRGEGVDALMARADRAMYEAKRTGRDRVVRFG